MKYTRKELGEYVKSRRKYFKLSQDRVAEMAKVSRQCIGRIEKGENTFPYILNAVLKALCIDPNHVTIAE